MSEETDIVRIVRHPAWEATNRPLGSYFRDGDITQRVDRGAPDYNPHAPSVFEHRGVYCTPSPGGSMRSRHWLINHAEGPLGKLSGPYSGTFASVKCQIGDAIDAILGRKP